MRVLLDPSSTEHDIKLALTALNPEFTSRLSAPLDEHQVGDFGDFAFRLREAEKLFQEALGLKFIVDAQEMSTRAQKYTKCVWTRDRS